MSTFESYDPCPRCTGGNQPGTVALAKYLDDHYPQSSNWGIYSCRPSTGGGGLSIHACGRALDLGVPSVSYGLPIVAQLVADPARYGLQGLIFNRRRYDYQSPAGRTYTGPNPHYDHLHIEQSREGAEHLTYADYDKEDPPPMVTYRKVRNVPDDNGVVRPWAKDVIDDGIAQDVIKFQTADGKELINDWNRNVDYGTLWSLLDRLKWPKGSQQ